MSVADDSAGDPAKSHDVSGDSTVVGSASASSLQLDKSNAIQKRLSVPHRPLQRQYSAESLFSGSDISELSFGSTQIDSGENEGLIRHVSITLEGNESASTWRGKLQYLWVDNYGAFLVLISQMFGCMMNIATRLLETEGPHGAPMHPFQILFARQSITVLITTCYALYTKSVPYFPLGPPGKVRLLLVSRGLFGFLGVFGLYFSLLYLPISEATILTFLAPIGSCYAFSVLIPGETFSKQQQIAGFVSLAGVVFIARPFSFFGAHENRANDSMSSGNATMIATGQEGSPQPTSAQHLQAVGIAMIGVVGAIGAMTSIRSIGNRAHALLSVNYFSAWCTFVSLAALILLPSVSFRMPANALEWGLLLMLGSAGFIMQLLLTQGMAYGSASINETRSPLDMQNDLEMQARTAEPQTSALAAVSAEAIRVKINKPTAKPQIKGSGAKATSMLYTQMLFALISDRVVFGITPGIWSWVGSGLILFGAIWVATDGGKFTVRSTSSDRVAETEAVSSSAQKIGSEEQVGLLAGAEAEASNHER